MQMAAPALEVKQPLMKLCLLFEVPAKPALTFGKQRSSHCLSYCNAPEEKRDGVCLRYRDNFAAANLFIFKENLATTTHKQAAHL